MNQAEICDLQRKDWTVRQVFLDGLADSYVKNDAFTRDLSINEALVMASRREVQDREIKQRSSTATKYESAEIKAKEDGDEIAIIRERKPNVVSDNRIQYSGKREFAGRGRGPQPNRARDSFRPRNFRDQRSLPYTEGQSNATKQEFGAERGTEARPKLGQYKVQRQGGSVCSRCGRPTCDGNQRYCQAIGKTCFHCRGLGHFAAMCNRGQVNMMEEKEPQPAEHTVKNHEEGNTQSAGWY